MVCPFETDDAQGEMAEQGFLAVHVYTP